MGGGVKSELHTTRITQYLDQRSLLTGNIMLTIIDNVFFRSCIKTTIKITKFPTSCHCLNHVHVTMMLRVSHKLNNGYQGSTTVAIQHAHYYVNDSGPGDKTNNKNKST